MRNDALQDIKNTPVMTGERVHMAMEQCSTMTMLRTTRKRTDEHNTMSTRNRTVDSGFVRIRSISETVSIEWGEFPVSLALLEPVDLFPMSGVTDSERYDVNDILKIDMLTAAYEQNNNEVLKLINDGAHVDSFDDDGVTALQIAASTGNINLVIRLLEKGADIERSNQIGMTPFLHACREGHLKVVETLLQRGADIHRLTYLGASSLTLAAGGGHIEVVKKLVGLRVDLRGSRGLCPTPLIAASFASNPTICGFLVQRGAPIDETIDSLYGLSALSCSIMCLNSIIIFASLLDLGANQFKRTLKNKNAEELAVYRKRNDIIDLLRKKALNKNTRVQPTTDIRQLVLNSNSDELEKALGRNETSPDGVPPLVFAALVGKNNIVRKLLEMRHSPTEAEAKFNLDALMVAALFREYEICENLIQNGANLYAVSSLNHTAYDLLHVSTEEIDPISRSELACASGKQRAKFSHSSNALTKLLNTGKQKLGRIPEKIESLSVKERDWLECRRKQMPMTGRNRKKLVLIDDVLRGTNTLTRPKKDSLNNYMEAVRALVEESTTFKMTCFYDLYNRESERKGQETDDSAITKLPRGEVDMVCYISSLYGFRGKRREAPVKRTSNIELPELRKKLRTPSHLDGSPPFYPVRTTPRMLKKSRESVAFEETRSLGRKDSAYSLDDSLKKSASTLSTSPHRRQRIVHVSYPDEVFIELRKMGHDRLVDILLENEIEGFQFLSFNEIDFNKMNIKDERDVQNLRSAQARIRRSQSNRCYSFSNIPT